MPLPAGDIPSDVREDTAFERRADLERAMATLSPRDRDMLWLAYADGASHEEIAVHLGLGRPSVKVMLFRARQRLASRLRELASDAGLRARLGAEATLAVPARFGRDRFGMALAAAYERLRAPAAAAALA